MCLDPRPDRLFRAARPARRVAGSATPRRRHLSSPPESAARTPALWAALDHLAGEDDLVARGWVVLSREA